VFVNLVDQRQIPVASLPGDLINANRLNTGQILMLTPSGHGSLHRAEHMIPGRTERLGNFFPAQALRPTGQKPGIGFSQSVFTNHPGHSLHPDTTAWTFDPAWRIKEKHFVTPHRDKLEAPRR